MFFSDNVSSSSDSAVGSYALQLSTPPAVSLLGRQLGSHMTRLTNDLMDEDQRPGVARGGGLGAVNHGEGDAW